MKMFDASPWGSPRLGQFGGFNPYSGANPYSWNVPGTQPGAFYGGPAIDPMSRVLMRSPVAAPPAPAGGYEAPMAAGDDCVTCTNPDTGDTKYGIPSSQAADLKSKGYKCRKDSCARSEGYGQFGSFGGGFFGSQTPVAPEGLAPANMESYSMLSGSRVPLVPGLGRRALG